MNGRKYMGCHWGDFTPISGVITLVITGDGAPGKKIRIFVPSQLVLPTDRIDY